MKIFYSIACVTFFCISCYGQSSYKNLTPGKSTRTDVERVLGQPVKELSTTLHEYAVLEPMQLFVQYSDASKTAVIERIEATCAWKGDSTNRCGSGTAFDTFSRDAGVFTEADVRVIGKEPTRATAYFGGPRFSRYVESWKADNEFEYRSSMFSPELYENTVPAGGCNGTIFDTWDTDPYWKASPTTHLDLGRVKIMKAANGALTGSYEKNNGTFSLRLDGDPKQNFIYGHTLYNGEWKDNAGSGTVVMRLRDDYKSIGARFSRTSGGVSKPGAKSACAPVTPYDRNIVMDNWYGKCDPGSQ